MNDSKFQFTLVVLCLANGAAFGWWKGAPAAVAALISTFLFCGLLVGIADIADKLKK